MNTQHLVDSATSTGFLSYNISIFDMFITHTGYRVCNSNSITLISSFNQAHTSVIRISPALMASVGARAYIGVLGLCPQRGPGPQPLVVGQGRSTPEAEDYFAL